MLFDKEDELSEYIDGDIDEYDEGLLDVFFDDEGEFDPDSFYKVIKGELPRSEGDSWVIHAGDSTIRFVPVVGSIPGVVRTLRAIGDERLGKKGTFEKIGWEALYSVTTIVPVAGGLVNYMLLGHPIHYYRYRDELMEVQDEVKNSEVLDDYGFDINEFLVEDKLKEGKDISNIEVEDVVDGLCIDFEDKSVSDEFVDWLNSEEDEYYLDDGKVCVNEEFLDG